ncbi:MAG: AAA family ATPase, partial [bacterium]
MPFPLHSLSPCQERAHELLQNSRDNVFLTGHAGSGKSFLTRHFLKDKDRKKFPVVASTGAAAVLVGGRTFHSFFGLGILEGGPGPTIEKALADRRLVKRLREMEGFVLDEVSMISGPTLSVAETICRKVRDHSLPWGGARVIAVGDFAQLPPVNPHSRKKEWAFLDEAWERSRFAPAVLKSILRSEDETYLRVLNFIR